MFSVSVVQNSTVRGNINENNLLTLMGRFNCSVYHCKQHFFHWKTKDFGLTNKSNLTTGLTLTGSIVPGFL